MKKIISAALWCGLFGLLGGFILGVLVEMSFGVFSFQWILGLLLAAVFGATMFSVGISLGSTLYLTKEVRSLKQDLFTAKGSAQQQAEETTPPDSDARSSSSIRPLNFP